MKNNVHCGLPESKGKRILLQTRIDKLNASYTLFRVSGFSRNEWPIGRYRGLSLMPCAYNLDWVKKGGHPCTACRA